MICLRTGRLSLPFFELHFKMATSRSINDRQLQQWWRLCLSDVM
jgi:hypothetical protein